MLFRSPSRRPLPLVLLPRSPSWRRPRQLRDVFSSPSSNSGHRSVTFPHAGRPPRQIRPLLLFPILLVSSVFLAWNMGSCGEHLMAVSRCRWTRTSSTTAAGQPTAMAMALPDPPAAAALPEDQARLLPLCGFCRAPQDPQSHAVRGG